MEPQETTQGKIAFQLASLLAAGDYVAAHEFLSASQKLAYPADKLKTAYEEMIDYGDGAVDEVEVMEILEDWPDRQVDDIGWAYVAMNGDGFGEAIAVVVCEEDSKLRVRDIEWGRP